MSGNWKFAAAAVFLVAGSVQAAPSGIGTTVDECNGVASITLKAKDKPDAALKAPAVLIWGRDSEVGLGHTIFAYPGMEKITKRTLPLEGNANTMQIRLALPTSTMPAPPKVGESYQGAFLISEWDGAKKAWATIGGSVVDVKITKYDLNKEAWESKDKMCAGIVEGNLEKTNGGTTLLYSFVAPLVTKNFPQ